MKKIKEGKKVRVVANTNEHNYTVGSVYTVSHVDTNDNTLKATDANGETGNWMRMSDVVAVGTVGWDFIKKVLPTDVIQFLSAFEGVEELELSDDVKDVILLSLGDLHERILKEVTKTEKGIPSGVPINKEGDMDDIFNP